VRVSGSQKLLSLAIEVHAPVSFSCKRLKNENCLKIIANHAKEIFSTREHKYENYKEISKFIKSLRMLIQSKALLE
jgi:hypothetical protein